jgi:hypothetical protein
MLFVNIFKYGMSTVNSYRGFEGSFIKVKQTSSLAGDEGTTVLLTVGSYNSYF